MNRHHAPQQAAPSWRVRALLGLFVVGGVVLAHGYRFPSSNHALELPPILAMLDPGLFQSDFYVQEMLRFTPRTYYHALIFMLAKAGLGVTAAYALAYVAALASLLLGLQAIARLFYRSQITAALLTFWALSVTAGLIAQSTLWPPFPIPTAFATGLTVWGIYFGLRRRWPAAYAFFGAACLLQFLVGLLPALLAAPLLALDAWRRRQWRQAALATALLGLGAGLVYVPMLLAGTTATGLLSGPAFVELYGFVRHPHHMVPSAWPRAEWAHLVLFYAGGVLCLLRSRTLPRAYRVGFVVVVVVLFAGLLVNFLFVEVWPSALVVRLQFSRMTPFAQLAVLIGLSVLFCEHLERGNGLVCALLAVLPVAHQPGLLLLLLGWGLPWLERVSPRLWAAPYRWAVILLAAALYRFPLSLDLGLWAQALAGGPVLLGVLVAPALVVGWIARERARLALAAALAVAVYAALAVAFSGALPGRLGALAARHLTLDGVWHDAPSRLALRFQERSPEDALVLVPPSVQSFRLLARRSVVVDFKAFPFTERGMLEWQARMDAVAACREQPPECLAEVARRYGAGYVLSRHAGVAPGVVDREGDWVIWRVAAEAGPPPPIPTQSGAPPTPAPRTSARP